MIVRHKELNNYCGFPASPQPTSPLLTFTLPKLARPYHYKLMASQPRICWLMPLPPPSVEFLFLFFLISILNHIISSSWICLDKLNDKVKRQGGCKTGNCNNFTAKIRCLNLCNFKFSGNEHIICECKPRPKNDLWNVQSSENGCKWVLCLDVYI